MEETELNSSKLGTHSYWQETYTQEIVNYEEHDDPGDVWFGEDIAMRVVHWICNCGAGKDTPIVDLGCGNGYTLMELAKEGFTNLLGIDYCEEAITLAEKISSSEFPSIKYKVFDITKDDVASLGEFGLVHDKGTYDAISLSQDARAQRERYIERVARLMGADGLFVITSCNWTEEELVKQFSEQMRVKCVIPTPQFKFGGKVGGVVSSVVFARK